MDCEIRRDEFDKAVSKVDSHHEKIAELERFKSSIPDAEALRSIEHVVEELPPTDDIKNTVSANMGRRQTVHRIFIGALVIVISTLLLVVASTLWQGIGAAFQVRP